MNLSRLPFYLSCALLCLLVSTSSFAQNPTGTLHGEVSYQDSALPGATITITSDAMMGEKTAVTSVNGTYIFRFLPPGTYSVSFAMDGFQTLVSEVRVSAAQSHQIDAVMILSAVSEEIEVTSSYDTIATSSQSAVTYDNELIESLPVGRDLNSAVLLSPGTTSNGPSGGITIAGSQSHENLFLVNGVVVNENVRGQAFDLFIEDAIQETTTSVSGISAEYGRFAGGVVNMVTKSGGNQFSGTYRLNLSNDDWTASTPLTSDKVDDINRVHEATLGGYLLKDNLWFFLAGRDRAITDSEQMYSGEPFSYGEDEQRYEIKLTYSPHSRHRLMGSFIGIDEEQTNFPFGTALEETALDKARTLPQELLALNYTGVMTDNFFVEAQYSERTMKFEGSGGDAAPGDRINGTSIYFYFPDAFAGSALFCGSCDTEERSNDNMLLKGSYFVATESYGSHDIVFGYDTFSDIVLSNNYQSSSNFVIWNYSDPLYENGEFYPVFYGGEDLDYWPILITSRGTDFETNSLFVNDRWRINSKITLSLGLRWDENDGKDGSGSVTADDTQLSPRVGLSYDIFGDGEWLISASYGRYVSAIANSVAGGAGAGNPSYIPYSYQGPPINVDADGNPVAMYTTPEALDLLFQWFDSVGGLANTDIWYTSPDIAGFNTFIEDLSSPYSDEYTIGLTKRLGNRGVIRADYIHREYGDFYATKRDTETGLITVDAELAPGVNIVQDLDLGYVVNENDLLRRDYDGLHTQFQYRVSDTVSLGGNWTWSHARGNFNGETAGSGPVTSGILAHPEYRELDWGYPVGDLAIDQRHKVRAWMVWDVLSTDRHSLSVSVMESFWSGTPYGALNTRVPVSPYVTNPGYAAPPDFASYYFTNRDAFRTDDITRTDLTLNYSFFYGLFGTDIELYIQPEVLNLFNEDGAIEVDQTVNLGTAFDPFTETPVEGVHWNKGSNFGKPTEEDHYQAPRTFRLSLGVRF